MRGILLFILSCFFVLSLIAQNKTLENKISNTIELKKGEDVIKIISEPDFGYLIKTGVSYSYKDVNIRIHNLRPDLSIRWTASLPIGIHTVYSNYLVGGKLSSYVYVIHTTKLKSDTSGSIMFNQIDSLGEVNSIEVPMTKDFNIISPLAIFQNNKSLFILSADRVTNDYTYIKVLQNYPFKGMPRKKLQFFILDHNESKIRKIDTDINLYQDEKGAKGSLEFLGNTQTEIFVAQKSLDPTENKIKYIIYTLSLEGSILNKAEFESSLSAKPYASLNFREGYGGENLGNDYTLNIYNYGNMTKLQYTKLVGSFGCCQLDLKNRKFYMYGLTYNDTIPTKIAFATYKSTVELFYVKKFDLDTKELLADVSGRMPETIMEDKAVKTIFFYERGLSLTIVDSTLVKLNIISKASLNVININFEKDEISNISKFVNPRKKETLNHLVYQTPLLVSNENSSKELVFKMKSFPSIRTRKFSLLGIQNDGKTALFQNSAFSRKPRLDIMLYNDAYRHE